MVVYIGLLNYKVLIVILCCFSLELKSAEQYMATYLRFCIIVKMDIALYRSLQFSRMTILPPVEELKQLLEGLKQFHTRFVAKYKIGTYSEQQSELGHV